MKFTLQADSFNGSTICKCFRLQKVNEPAREGEPDRIKTGPKSYRVGAHLPFAERALTKPTTQRVAETQRTK
jgi:hypothetical protein